MLTPDQYSTGAGEVSAIRDIWDITEDEPIPAGAIVSVEDWDPCADSNGLYVVEYNSKMYLAAPDELKIRIPSIKRSQK